MIYSVYSIFDCVQNSFQAHIMLAFNDDDAKRNFSALVNSAGTIYNSFPSDFKLFKIAEFNMKDGRLSDCIPFTVCSGLDVIKKGDD